MDDYVFCNECEESCTCPDACRMDGCECGNKTLMTLDEAIKHAEEIANIECNKCGEEHKQLAKWLRHYKKLLERIKNERSK